MSEIADSYLDVWQKEHKIEPETRRALEKALGPRRPAKKSALPRGACYQPALLEKGGRVWGFMVQLYGLRSARNWGVGDFTDLRTLVELAGGMGAAVVGVNPLHAAWVSPYSPSSRHALNPVYLDVEAITEFAECAPARERVASSDFQKNLSSLRNQELVNYDAVRAAKRDVLELLYASFRRHRGRRERLAQFNRRSSRELRRYALYEALAEELGGYWQTWPLP
jgi:(1->4)-alpha-D-glucan 1-alpha-D-glucosylmutase